MSLFVDQFGDDQLLDRALHELQAIPDDRFDLLENPFEKKLVLSPIYMEKLPEALEHTVLSLETTWQDRAKKGFDVDLWTDSSRHYCSVFKYLPGGFLSCHVDAGLHPLNHMRKHVTAIVYLGETDDGGELEFWDGETAILPNPKILELKTKIKPEHGKIALFECDDYAWHSVSECLGEKPRYAITVSYLSMETERWHKRERAFFAPRPNEVWSKETYKIRDTRADSEQYSEAYRT